MAARRPTPFFLLELLEGKIVKRIIKMLARGLGVASLATLLSSGSASVAALSPLALRRELPAKRLVLDYSPVTLNGHADLQRFAQHNSHRSHSSHHSHYSGR